MAFHAYFDLLRSPQSSHTARDMASDELPIFKFLNSWTSVLKFDYLELQKKQAFAIMHIKVWVVAYPTEADGASNNGDVGVLSASTHLGSSYEPGTCSINYINPMFGKAYQIDAKYYLGIYFILGILAVVVTSIRSLAIFYGPIKASRRLHERLLDEILRAKVRFFHSTPMSRVVNRFSSDLATSDAFAAPLYGCHQWADSIDGVDTSTLGLEDLRSRIITIPQDPVFFSGTLRTNLDLFGQHDDVELWAALKHSHLIDHHGADDNKNATLDSLISENGSDWSQATSSVDFDTDHQIQQTIRTEFMCESSLLCIAHRLWTVANYDRILMLDHGQAMEFDTPYNLITREDSVFQQICERSDEFNGLLFIATTKHE
ncbi:P-loop containing nucleoside triphosphate hydrolase protein [Fennellomyces sp. T-0311]|nr:P-loop containing nucleoside triphosphate hydrolase protein [Fennellomyces sp. T-0311]